MQNAAEKLKYKPLKKAYSFTTWTQRRPSGSRTYSFEERMKRRRFGATIISTATLYCHSVLTITFSIYSSQPPDHLT